MTLVAWAKAPMASTQACRAIRHYCTSWTRRRLGSDADKQQRMIHINLYYCTCFDESRAKGGKNWAVLTWTAQLRFQVALLWEMLGTVGLADGNVASSCQTGDRVLPA